MYANASRLHCKIFFMKKYKYYSKNSEMVNQVKLPYKVILKFMH